QSAQSLSPLSLAISGSFYAPVADSSPYFGFGAGGDLSLGYQIPRTQFLALGGLSYSYTPGKYVQTISIVAAELGFGMRFPIAPSLSLLAYGTAGYWYGTFNDFSVSSTDPYAGVGLALQLALSPTFGLDFGTQYKNYFGLWQGLTAGIGM